MLQCADGTIYTGITNDLESRIKAHNSGKGAKYTRGRAPVSIMAVFEFDSKSEAARAEYRIKKLPKPKKLKLIGQANTI